MGPCGGQTGQRPKDRWRLRSVLLGLALAFLPWPVFAANGALPPDAALVMIVVAGGALALAGGLWALAEHDAAHRLRRAVKLAATRARAAVSSREALLAAGREAIAAWGRDGEVLSFGSGGELLQASLEGPDALALSMALDALSESGTPFTQDARTPDNRTFTVRGRTAGGYAAVFLEAIQRASVTEPDFRAVLEALPIPVWMRDQHLALLWANRAFLAASEAASLESALASDIALDRSERDLASAVLSENEPVEAKRYAVVGGQRRAFTFSLLPLKNGDVMGMAIDITATAEAEARLQQHIDAYADTLNRLTTAVAIFGSDRKLAFYNRAYVKLWSLSETWLDTHPSDSEILDRLRELRRLPEQRDFQAWKRSRLKLYEQAGEHPEELWHLSGGKTLRALAQPHPLGGLIFLFEDVSDQIRLESSINTVSKVQKATLDTLQEAAAVFGPDGRLKLHNAAFERLWQLSAEELAGEPHLKRIVDACTARFGPDKIWEIVSSGVTSDAPERRRELDEVTRSDGTVISLSLLPLPDGATLASFVDVTDRFRIESALRERNEALEAVDKLKSEFVKRVSYELRTPLNSILGFTEMLRAGTPGPLTPQQNEYLDAVLKASNALRDMINDLLDLSQIEAGAMELDLEKLNLYTLLAGVAEHAQEWAGKAGLTLFLQCSESAGTFVADGRRIRQVLFNLLSNAFKYTPRGGAITLGGEITGEDVQIVVADTGPGLPAEVKASAFKSFAAENAPAARAGAGLGLALVNRFVELHGGWVELESSPDIGTRVTCHLPRSGNRAIVGESKSREQTARA
jgi:signal transduction histidine kinase